MRMTDNEVKRNVLGAKNQKAQIQICADLNEVDKQMIIEILKEQGVDLRKLKGSTNRPAGTKPHKPHKKYKKPEIIPAPPVAAEKQQKSENAAEKQQNDIDLTAAYQRVGVLLAERKKIDDELQSIRSKLSKLNELIEEGMHESTNC